MRGHPEFRNKEQESAVPDQLPAAWQERSSLVEDLMGMVVDKNKIRLTMKTHLTAASHETTAGQQRTSISMVIQFESNELMQL